MIAAIIMGIIAIALFINHELSNQELDDWEIAERRRKERLKRYGRNTK